MLTDLHSEWCKSASGIFTTYLGCCKRLATLRGEVRIAPYVAEDHLVSLWQSLPTSSAVSDPPPARLQTFSLDPAPLSSSQVSFCVSCRRKRWSKVFIFSFLSVFPTGHGFKFAPVIGKILCELSLGEKPIYNLAPFQISRFSNLPKAVM